MSKNKKTDAVEAIDFTQATHESGADAHEQQPVVEEQGAPQEPLQPYDKVQLTYADGRTEVCFWVGDGTYSRANSQGKAFKVGQPRENVVGIEKLLQ